MAQSLAVRRTKGCGHAGARPRNRRAIRGARPPGEILTAVHHIPAREAKFAPMPEWVRAELAAAYAEKGVAELYSHQAMAAAAVQEGRNVVVVTPTASGKTLCYNLPVLNAVLENPDTRALYLFPTKALAQDQLAELHESCPRASTIDSVSSPTTAIRPPTRAKRFASAGTSCSTNPDMLHTGILPHHTRWQRLFREFALRRAGRTAHLSRRVRQPPGQRVAAAAAHRALLRLESAIHLLVGDDCESRRTGIAAGGNRFRCDRGKWRARGREIFRLLQSAGGEPFSRNTPQLHQRSRRAWRRNS